MGFDKNEVWRCINATGNVTAAMVEYIEANGCGQFRCKKCPLSLVCDHHPDHARDYAHAVIEEILRRASQSKS